MKELTNLYVLATKKTTGIAMKLGVLDLSDDDQRVAARALVALMEEQGGCNGENSDLIIQSAVDGIKTKNGKFKFFYSDDGTDGATRVRQAAKAFNQDGSVAAKKKTAVLDGNVAMDTDIQPMIVIHSFVVVQYGYPSWVDVEDHEEDAKPEYHIYIAALGGANEQSHGIYVKAAGTYVLLQALIMPLEEYTDENYWKPTYDGDPGFSEGDQFGADEPQATLIASTDLLRDKYYPKFGFTVVDFGKHTMQLGTP